MRIEILGCSGGIGGKLRTTAMLVDHDILVDAGTGVGDLSIEQLVAIDHIFVTHSHLDHVGFIPLLLDTVMGLRSEPVTVHGSALTLQALKQHIFNWKVWPDFNAIPNSEFPLLQYQEMKLGQTVSIDGRHFTSLPANHVVPAVGYRIDSGQASLVFTGDTSTCDALWTQVNRIDNLKYLLIETAFSNAEIELARLSKHLCPDLLVKELSKLKVPVQLFITHLKPGEGAMIMQEIADSPLRLTPQALKNGQVFEF